MATTKVVASNAAESAPSPTLYLTNLPDKLRKPDLKTSLYMLFSTYGVVLDINAMRSNMRGQAHVVMRDVAASTQAMRALQGFEFFGRELKIKYSDEKKGRSHIFNRLEGEWKESDGAGKATEKQQSAFEAPRPGQAAERDKAGPGLNSKSAEAVGGAEAHGTKRAREEDEDDEDDGEAPMEEDEDDDVEMEESDED